MMSIHTLRSHATTAATAATTAILAASLSLAAPAAAQHPDHHEGHSHPDMPTAGFRAELIHDLDAVAEKFVSLLDAMTDHLNWRPGEGVRSAGEVFSHVAAGNFMLSTMAGGHLPEGMGREEVQAMAALEEPARIREALAHSFRHLSHTVAGTPDESLDDATTLFGRETTKRAALLLLATHAHEHLGQAIAYARTNGVTPPWSVAAGQ
jgi:uncharacterized damage-inducible protein DinB